MILIRVLVVGDRLSAIVADMVIVRVCVIGDCLSAEVTDVIFVRVLVVGDYLFAIVADVVFVCVLVVGDCLSAEVTDVILICILMIGNHFATVIADVILIRVLVVGDYLFAIVANVVFVCVKGYSLEGILPLLRRCCHKSTLVIPILNLYGTGEKLAALLPGVNVLDGCIYIASEIAGPGRLLMKGEIFRVVFGPRDGHIQTPLLQKIRSDLAESGITPVLSSQIKKDTYRKFSYVSAQNAVGLYYHANAGEIIRTPEYTRSFLNCVEELRRLGLAFGVRLEDDIAQINLSILSGLEPSMTTSMQKDLAQGGPSEIDGLIYEVVRLGKTQNLSLPLYETIGKALKERYKA